MENNEVKQDEVKYYTSSDGTKTPIKEIEFTHLSNGLAKKYRDIYNVSTKKEFNTKLKEINDMKEEIFRRYNEFYDTLKDEEE